MSACPGAPHCAMLAPLMPLLNLLNAELAFGTHPLLDRAEFSLEPGERIGLIGRNGTGKSSLLEVIAGRIALDDGELQKSGNLRVVSIRQEPELPAAPTLRESLALWAELDSFDDDRMRWRVDARIVEYLHRFGLEGTATTAGLSGGERKRAALAGAFALEPDVLLLDEPTNHLDIDGIEWLEDLLHRGQPGRLSSRTIARSWTASPRASSSSTAASCAPSPATTPRTNDEGGAARQRSRAQPQVRQVPGAGRGLDPQGRRGAPHAQRGPRERLEELRRDRDARRERIGNVKLTSMPASARASWSPKCADVTKRFGERAVVRDLDLRVLRGDRLGLIGPNGAGKTTLLKLILGELEPDAGDVRRGTQLEVAYFDQLRAQLDPDAGRCDTSARTATGR